MLSDYHKAVVGAVAGGIVAAISVITATMTVEDTFSDIPAVTWLLAVGAFLIGAGLTGGAVAVSAPNTVKGVKAQPPSSES